MLRALSQGYSNCLKRDTYKPKDLLSSDYRQAALQIQKLKVKQIT